MFSCMCVLSRAQHKVSVPSLRSGGINITLTWTQYFDYSLARPVGRNQTDLNTKPSSDK